MSARDDDHQANAGMHRIDQIIFAVDFVDVDCVGVSPSGRPWIVIHPVVAAVVEAAIVVARYAEGVLAAEVLVKVLFADAARVAVAAVALRLRVLGVILSRNLLLFCGLLVLLVGRLLLLFRGVLFFLLRFLCLL